MSEANIRDEILSISKKLSEIARNDGNSHYLIERKAKSRKSIFDNDPYLLKTNSLRKRTADTIYRLRRMREELFPAGLFADPSWDILLDLYFHAKAGRQISTTSSCIASSVAPTTALRHLKALEKAGLLTRTPQESDRRYTLIKLTESGEEKMDKIMSLWMDAFSEEPSSERPHR